MLLAKSNPTPALGFGLLLALACSSGLTATAQSYPTRIIEEGEAPTPPILPEDLPPADPSFELPIPQGIPAAPPSDPNGIRSLSPANTLLSLPGGQRLMDEAGAAIGAQNYSLAIQKLKEARQVYNQLSNFYSQLSDSFSGIDNRISEAQRNNALMTAEMRDRATYQLALVHRAQNRPELSVPLLIQIVRSQNPTTDLGKKAYQQLFELGFVESPFPRPRANLTAPSGN